MIARAFNQQWYRRQVALNRRTFIHRAGTVAAVLVGHQMVGQLPGAVAVIPAPNAAQAPPLFTNLVTNPSFEADGVSSSITGWVLSR